MSGLLVLPVLIPIVVACLTIMLWRSRRGQRVISIVGMAGHLASSIALLAAVDRQDVLVDSMGGYAAPYGISFVADRLAAIMVLLAALQGAAVVVYSSVSIDAGREVFGFHPLIHVLLAGVCGAFLTGDLFNMYVFFEVLLMSSFVLLTLGGERGQIEGAIKYVTLNLLSSAIFLAAVGLMYGSTGTLNMADLAVKLPAAGQPQLSTVLAMMFLVAFGIKAAIFPLFFWLPASYHTPPVAVSAIFAGLLTKVGVYALIRVFTLIFVHDVGFTHSIILVIAALTMVTGVLGAAVQEEFRRILSFHIISQIGYMLMGLGLVSALAWSDSDQTRAGVTLALAGSVFYIAHHIVVKGNLFLISGVVERLQGTGSLRQSGGFYAAWPRLSILFLIPALSLAGIPPLSGFWAKLALVKAGLELGQYTMVGIALAVGLLTLFSMTKIWGAVFWAAAPAEGPMATDNLAYRRAQRNIGGMIAPIAVLALVTVGIGLMVGPIFDLAMRAGEQLIDPQVYIDAVQPVDRSGAWVEEVR